jgi:DNA-binding PadR family transcriptional regulator
MTPVFAHGSLRLYLLHLLQESPKHGYELIQALTDRFGGTYSPSAGTIYPRLAKLEEEGLVTKTTDGRKSIYTITDAGRAELAAKADQLSSIENEVTDSVRRLADEVRSDVSAAMRSLRADLASAAREPEPHGQKKSWSDWGFGNPWGDASARPEHGRGGAPAGAAPDTAPAGSDFTGGTAEHDSDNRSANFEPTTGSPSGFDSAAGTAAPETGSSGTGSHSGTPGAGSDAPRDTSGTSAGDASGGSSADASSTPSPGLDPRVAARLALGEAELSLNDARQQIRAELRRRAADGSLSNDDVRELRSRLADVVIWLRKR